MKSCRKQWVSDERFGLGGLPFYRWIVIPGSHASEEAMIQRGDLRIIEDEVRRLNRDFADPGDERTHRTSVALFSAALGVGGDVDDLADFTDYPRAFIVAISHRMNVAGLWDDDRVHHEHWWVDNQFETIQPMAFWLDVLVADGSLVAKRMGNGRFRYWTAGFGPRSHRVLM